MITLYSRLGQTIIACASYPDHMRQEDIIHHWLHNSYKFELEPPSLINFYELLESNMYHLDNWYIGGYTGWISDGSGSEPIYFQFKKEDRLIYNIVEYPKHE